MHQIIELELHSNSETLSSPHETSLKNTVDPFIIYILGT